MTDRADRAWRRLARYDDPETTQPGPDPGAGPGAPGGATGRPDLGPGPGGTD